MSIQGFVIPGATGKPGLLVTVHKREEDGLIVLSTPFNGEWIAGTPRNMAALGRALVKTAADAKKRR